MLLPDLIAQIEAILGFRLHPAPVRAEDYLSGLMAYKSDPEDRERPWCKYAAREGHIIGLNIANIRLKDKKLAQILALPGLDLRYIQALNISNNAIKKLDLCSLPALQWLDANENEALVEISLPQAGLPELRELRLYGCPKLTKLSLPRNMTGLQVADMGYSGLQQISFGGACPALRQLDLRQNRLQHFHLPEGFGALEYLNLDDNALEHYSSVQRLPALRSLYLRRNQLTRFTSAMMAQMPALEALYLFDNKLEGVLQEIIGNEHKNCYTDLKNYFSSADKSSLIRLHEAKMILVGNGEVGKSSIRLKLEDINNPLVEKEDRTQGLDIGSYAIKDLQPFFTGLREPVNFQFHIWDFGGQGKYREVQQLFCSRRAMYLFVTAHDDKPEKDHYADFPYWLSMVNAYSYDQLEGRPSPVIHVVNKMDEKPHYTDQQREKKQFDNIAGFVHISCKTLLNFDKLKELIAKTLPDISPDIFHREIPGNWLKVKATLEGKKAENHITYAGFLKICTEENGLNEDEARSCLRTLDQIGAVIAFGENPQLKDWIVLNPNWVKGALYQVLDSRAAVGGVLTPGAFEDIWSEDKGYQPEDRQHLLSLMEAYDLCYSRQNDFGETEYVLPALLPDKQPQLPKPFEAPACNLRFVFEPYYPAGALNKLMVRLHRLIYGGLKWKDNVVLHEVQENSLVHLQEKWQEHAIEAVFCGNEFGTLFGLVQRELNDIAQTLKDTRFMYHLGLKCEARWEDAWLPLSVWEQLSNKKISSKPMEADDIGRLRAGRNQGAGNVVAPPPIPMPPKRGDANTQELPTDEKIKILFVASNPMDENRIQPDVEYRKLKDELKRGLHRDRFELLDPCFAATIEALLRDKNQAPHILHFAGHGTKEGIILTDSHANESRVLKERALRRLFNDLQQSVRLVILNACYSAEHARVISEYGIWVIGHNLGIGDNAAIRFAEGLYTGLGEGRDIKGAYNDGMILIENDFEAEAGKIEVWKDGEKLVI